MTQSLLLHLAAVLANFQRNGIYQSCMLSPTSDDEAEFRSCCQTECFVGLCGSCLFVFLPSLACCVSNGCVWLQTQETPSEHGGLKMLLIEDF